MTKINIKHGWKDTVCKQEVKSLRQWNGPFFMFTVGAKRTGFKVEVSGVTHIILQFFFTYFSSLFMVLGS